MTVDGALDNEEDVAILVPSWDGCEDIWKPFFHLLFKYWPDCPYPVYLGSNFTTYPDPRVRPISVGRDVDFSTNLIAMLRCIESRWVIIWVDDAFLSAEVDTARFTHIVDAARDRGAGYLKLLTGTSTCAVPIRGFEFGHIPKNIPYRVSVSIGLWEKNVLLRLLRAGESAWAIEYCGSRRSYEFGEEFLCLVGVPLISLTHGVIKGKWTRSAIELLRNEGLESCIGKRGVQPLWMSLYVQIRRLVPRQIVTWRHSRIR